MSFNTGIWDVLLNHLAEQFNTAVKTQKKDYGKVFDNIPESAKYVLLDDVVVGPFADKEGFTGWKPEYDSVIKACIQQAVVAAKYELSLTKELSDSQLIQVFNQVANRALSIKHLIELSSDFLVRTFNLSNIFFSVNDIHASFLKCSQPMQLVIQRVLAQVRSSKTACFSRDVSSDVLFQGLKELNNLPKFVAGFPVLHNKVLLGIVVLFAEHNKFDRATIILGEFTNLLQRLDQLERVQTSAVTDTLTSLFNRSALTERLERVIENLRESEKSISVLMIDVDDFKKFNDAKGHPEGDIVLKKVGDVLRTVVSDSGICCRYGGEEFTVVLPAIEPQAAQAVAEDIRKEVERVCPLTVSIGMITCLNSSAQKEKLIKEADAALYRAKHFGKNRVVAKVMVDQYLGIIDV